MNNLLTCRYTSLLHVTFTAELEQSDFLRHNVCSDSAVNGFFYGESGRTEEKPLWTHAWKSQEKEKCGWALSACWKPLLFLHGKEHPSPSPHLQSKVVQSGEKYKTCSSVLTRNFLKALQKITSIPWTFPRGSVTSLLQSDTSVTLLQNNISDIFQKGQLAAGFLPKGWWRLRCLFWYNSDTHIASPIWGSHLLCTFAQSRKKHWFAPLDEPNKTCTWECNLYYLSEHIFAS